jgi:hypothetical protein
MIETGEIDALQAPHPPSTFYSAPDAVKRLHENYVEIERAYFRKTRIFPIMHTVAIRRELYEANRWIAQALFKAFLAAQRKVYRWRRSKKRSASWAMTGGPMASSPIGTCSTPSCAITTNRACRRGA